MRAVSPLPPDLDGPPGRPGEARSAEEESALVARVLAGDHEALGQLVAPYVGSLRRVARAILGDVDHADDDPLPDAETERVVLGERLEAALGQLPARYRTALVLFDVEGYSHGEIAEMLGVAPGTVRSAVFHARRRLRRLLADWRVR